jgi:glutamate---cysteine ligase / carboxylate-amine ligase
MEHEFSRSPHGPFSIGIEEELMIVDDGSFDLVCAIERLLEETSNDQIRPELMESVLEIATPPCATIADAYRSLVGLRREVCALARNQGVAIGSSGTHPFARWEDQRIVQRPRYRDLIDALRFVARQELIFGLHVHVGIDDPDTAIYVADGMRVHVPILQALSANSPFWRGDATGMMSTRTPIFRAFPRVGIPPFFGDWDNYSRQITFMVESGVIHDYTYLWYDVRPHPRFGTVEIRVCDAQTRVEHTIGLAALVQAMVRELAEQHRAGAVPDDHPWQMLDENKWLAARHGLDAELVDLPSAERVPAKTLARRLLERLGPYADDLGGADALDGVRDLIDRGTGASRQRVVFEANHDLREVMREIVAVTEPPPIALSHTADEPDAP